MSGPKNSSDEQAHFLRGELWEVSQVCHLLLYCVCGGGGGLKGLNLSLKGFLLWEAKIKPFNTGNLIVNSTLPLWSMLSKVDFVGQHVLLKQIQHSWKASSTFSDSRVSSLSLVGIHRFMGRNLFRYKQSYKFQILKPSSIFWLRLGLVDFSYIK